MKALIPKLLLSAALALTIYVAALVYDALANAKYFGRYSSCKANLRHIGAQLKLYRKHHDGRLPTSLIHIAKSDQKYSLMCPLVSFELEPGKLTYYSYVYRYLSTPRSNDIISWDRKPHIPQYSIFVYKNRPCRNVLFVDGTVKTIDEEEFRSRHLVGKVEELDAYNHNWIR